MDQTKIQAEISRFAKSVADGTNIDGGHRGFREPLGGILSNSIRQFANKMGYDDILRIYGKAGLNIVYLRENLALEHHDYDTFLGGDLKKDLAQDSIKDINELNKLATLLVSNDIKLSGLASRHVKQIFPRSIYTLTKDVVTQRHQRFLASRELRQECRQVDRIMIDSIWDDTSKQDYDDIFPSFAILARHGKELHDQILQLSRIKDDFYRNCCNLLAEKVSERLKLLQDIRSKQYYGYFQIPLRQIFHMMGRLLDISFSLDAIHSWRKQRQSAQWMCSEVLKDFRSSSSTQCGFAMRYYPVSKDYVSLQRSTHRLVDNLDTYRTQAYSNGVLFDNYFIGLPTVATPKSSVTLEKDGDVVEFKYNPSDETLEYDFDKKFCEYHSLPQVLVGMRDQKSYLIDLGTLIR